MQGSGSQPQFQKLPNLNKKQLAKAQALEDKSFHFEPKVGAKHRRSTSNSVRVKKVQRAKTVAKNISYLHMKVFKEDLVVPTGGSSTARGLTANNDLNTSRTVASSNAGTIPTAPMQTQAQLNQILVENQNRHAAQQDGVHWPTFGLTPKNAYKITNNSRPALPAAVN